MYDIVYPLKEQNKNIDLLYSLRSLEKFGCEYGQVWIVGYLPEWITNVRHIKTVQNSDKWANTQGNWTAICECDEVSEDIIVMNDDFIFSQPVKSWESLTDCYLGTMQERAEFFTNNGYKPSKWRNAFSFNHNLLQSMGVAEPLDYEFHGPVIINRKKRLALQSRKEIKPYMADSESLIMLRSVYQNVYRKDRPTRKIHDYKFMADAFNPEEMLINGFFSVDDEIIGDDTRCPKLNAWLKRTFPSKSKYEI